MRTVGAPGLPATRRGAASVALRTDRHPLIERPRLHALLDRAPAHRVVAIVAPTGWGKTALLRTWSQACGAPLVSLRGAPVDADRLERALAAAHASHPHAPAIAIDDVETLSGPGLASLRARIARRGTPLVVAGRTEPAIGLPRLRLHGDVLELRAGDLALTEVEAAELLDLLHVPLPAPDVERLVARTEGWAAAVRLAAASLAHAPDAGRFLEEFDGTDRAIADYLTDEVLATVDADTRAFLLSASVVDDVCAELAAALTGRDDGGEVLDRLELDRGAFACILGGTTLYVMAANWGPSGVSDGVVVTAPAPAGPAG
ncbi:MAG TPA: hypothetical protein VHB30_01275, partial [Solirubrobacteraceae bacterium]|nr:hypothetical protein [Solirubrobacteraceae bacterium]